MMRSTVSDPVGGSGLASEPTTLCVESAAKSLLAAAPVAPDMPYGVLLLYPLPHAARPKAAMRANGAARRKPFRIRVKVNMSVSFVLRVCAANLTICCRAEALRNAEKTRQGR